MKKISVLFSAYSPYKNMQKSCLNIIQTSTYYCLIPATQQNITSYF